jgi:hypothetical protein
MKLTLKREPSTTKSTPGKLYVDGVFECYTLEDVVRPSKIYGETAIPAGTYKVIISMSNRFKRLLPLLLNVPNYEGIRIHPGNTDKDTEGCILPGVTRSVDFVGNSRVAFDALFAKMQKADSIEITIEPA